MRRWGWERGWAVGVEGLAAINLELLQRTSRSEERWKKEGEIENKSTLPFPLLSFSTLLSSRSMSRIDVTSSREPVAS